jgi:hypothetical protein
MEQLGGHWTGFCEILYLGFLLKPVWQKQQATLHDD